MSISDKPAVLEYHTHAILDRWEEALRVFEDPASSLADVKVTMQGVMRDLIANELGADPCEAMGVGWRPRPYPLEEAKAA